MQIAEFKLQIEKPFCNLLFEICNLRFH